MAIQSLDDLFHDGLRDIYYAEKQIIRTLSQIGKKVDSDELREALDNHRQESETQVQRLEQVFQMIEERPRAKKCPGIEGIIAEGKETMEEIEDEQVRDAAIVGAAQAIEHYEITRYGTLIAWARKLGHEKAAELLSETLEEEKATDSLLTELAESMVNQEAGEDEEMEEDEEQEDEEQPTATRRKARA